MVIQLIVSNQTLIIKMPQHVVYPTFISSLEYYNVFCNKSVMYILNLKASIIIYHQLASDALLLLKCKKKKNAVTLIFSKRRKPGIRTTLNIANHQHWPVTQQCSQNNFGCVTVKQESTVPQCYSTNRLHSNCIPQLPHLLNKVTKPFSISSTSPTFLK